jgi:uncharacterized protein (DUF58 family)
MGLRALIRPSAAHKAGTQSVEVAPRLATAPERVLHRLDWTVIRRLDGLLQGNYHTLFYGPGLDFADLREYQAEDDIRHIDWNVTARLNQPYVRQYYEEREITAWFLLDLTASMDFGPPDHTKQRVMIDLTATLARLLTRNGNRVGAMLYAGGVERTIPPLGGQKQVLRLIRDLGRQNRNSQAGETDLRVLLQAAHNTLKRRSLVFLVSDFLSLPGWEKPLALLNRRHDLVAIRLWDRLEDQLPPAGMLFVQDSETGEQVYVDTSDPVFRQRLSATTARREAELQASLSRAGAELFAVSTDDDLVTALVRMASLRKRRRR